MWGSVVRCVGPVLLSPWFGGRGAGGGGGGGTLSPSAYSTIADRFPPRRLGIAIAIYAIGVSLGGGLATMFGGVLVNWATDHSVTVPLVGAVGGWRLAIFEIGRAHV